MTLQVHTEHLIGGNQKITLDQSKNDDLPQL